MIKNEMVCLQPVFLIVISSKTVILDYSQVIQKKSFLPPKGTPGSRPY